VSAHLGSVRRSLELDAATSTPGSASKPVVRRWNSGLAWGEDGLSRHCYVSLSEPGLLPWLCCLTPGFCLFGTLLVILAAAAFSQVAFYYLTALLTGYVACWSANLAVSCTVGFLNMRRDSSKDWHAMLREVQAKTSNASVMHIVILPNYKEDEEMMWRTLDNLARSRLAKSSVRVCLGMEGREEGARDKAERLMERARPHFLDVCASFHPAGLPMELAGKSSNTQWAYRHILQTYGTDLQHRDPSKVFLTVGDADTLFHPQYLSALSLQALQMSVQERSWSFWQPPVFIMRNLFSVPGPTRVSSYATVSFELGGLANQKVGHHFCYSSYSTTLALTMHPLVDGWDRDVIAEDHHMFCKGFFAAVRESLSKPKAPGIPAPKPEVRLQPVFLPALSYLVDAGESNTAKGWLRSCHARFVQARRHSQGIAELSYVILQYVSLVQRAGFWKLPFRTHTQVWGIMSKMGMVHIISQVHSFALINTFVYMAIEAVRWALGGGLSVLLGDIAANGASTALASQSLGGIGWTGITAIFGPVPPIAMLMGWVTYTVVRDVVEGRLTEAMPAEREGGEGPRALVPVVPDVDGSALAEPGAKVGDLGWKARALLCVQILTDHVNYAEITMFGYGFIPAILAAWSLMRRGTEFEYIVAAKPTC